MATRQFMPPEEEALMKNRLLTREAPFRTLARAFSQYTEDIKNGRMQQAADSLKKMMHDLAVLEAHRRKLNAVCTLNDKEQERYAEKLANCQKSFDQAQQDIEAKKRELQAARIDRQHCEEYEVLRHQIMEHPRRPDTQKEIESVMADIGQISAKLQQYQQHLDLKKKQFAMLLHSIQDLQGLGDDTTEFPDEARGDAMQE